MAHVARIAYTPPYALEKASAQSSKNGADQDSTPVMKLQVHAELVTELVNPLLQLSIVANDETFEGYALAA